MLSVTKLGDKLKSDDQYRIAERPAPAVTSDSSPIFGSTVKYKFARMNAEDKGSGLSCAAVSKTATTNGSYLHFETNGCTVATMDLNNRIVAAGNFTGGDFEIYRSAPSTYKCVHVNSSAVSNLKLQRASIASCADAKGWTRIDVVRSGDISMLGSAGCVEAFVISLLMPNERIDTYLLSLTSKGTAMARAKLSSVAT